MGFSFKEPEWEKPHLDLEKSSIWSHYTTTGERIGGEDIFVASLTIFMVTVSLFE